MGPEQDFSGHEHDMAAAEFALGVLDGDDRAAALRRIIGEPAFAREVETWRAQFGALFAQWPEQAPPEQLLRRIQQSIEPVPRPARFWPAATAVLSLVAASLLLVIVMRPAVQLPVLAQPNVLVASLAPAEAGPALPAIYDPARGELRVTAAALAPAGRSAELWLIGGDGTPRSLGLLNATDRTIIHIAPADRSKLTTGVKLAISNEPLGGSPSGLPTGPIMASGALISS